MTDLNIAYAMMGTGVGMIVGYLAAGFLHWRSNR